jgi:hypothetical protein
MGAGHRCRERRQPRGRGDAGLRACERVLAVGPADWGGDACEGGRRRPRVARAEEEDGHAEDVAEHAAEAVLERPLLLRDRRLREGDSSARSASGSVLSTMLFRSTHTDASPMKGSMRQAWTPAGPVPSGQQRSRTGPTATVMQGIASRRRARAAAWAGPQAGHRPRRTAAATGTGGRCPLRRTVTRRSRRTTGGPSAARQSSVGWVRTTGSGVSVVKAPDSTASRVTKRMAARWIESDGGSAVIRVIASRVGGPNRTRASAIRTPKASSGHRPS